MAPLLAQTQRWFLELATRTTPFKVECASSTNQQVALRELSQRVRRPPTESAAERFEIYRRSYFSRLEDCLADDYPALKYAIGDTAFSALCQSYALACPSTSTNLNGYGAQLPSFIRISGTFGDFEVELATLEWALVEALHSAAPSSELLAALQAIPPASLPSLRFVASPALRLLAGQYPVNAYFQSFITRAVAVRPAAQPASVAVVRKEYTIWRIDLDAAQVEVLGRLMSGRPLGEALAGVAASPAQVQRWFKSWSSCGVFVDARTA